MTTDYKSTLFLPRSDFPMRAQLPKREPEMLARWAEMDLFARMRAMAPGREKFVLHDGPPYANGHLHIGHALNKILKDVICRSRQMGGKDANYVPGWDCHGLPIEWKIEEEYRAAGKNKDEVPIVEFRRECREFAEKWVDIQRAEFKRLGVEGDWDAPYTTMAYAAEATIVRELGRFLMNGGLYLGARPVMWSIVEKTALAEAEIEYHDRESITVYVRFPVIESALPALADTSVVIWTTTPWTIPGNRALVFGADIDYRVIEVTEVAEGSLAVTGERIAVAAALADDMAAACGIAGFAVRAEFKGRDAAGTVCRHPLRGQGYDHDARMIPAPYVTTEQGTGFVHIAPAHGYEDWEVGKEFGIEIVDTVTDAGRFRDDLPLFAGKQVFKVGDEIAETLATAGGLLGRGKLVHSYPHSWRSKAPLIYRTTPQWFISMTTNDLRAKALAAIEETSWFPAWGRNRIHGMVDTRPDWCVSRQRAWGVPITVFIDKKTNEPLRDQGVIDRIAGAVDAEGSDVWFTADPARFLGPEYDPADYHQVRDILDVWFDSGSTHSFVLEARDDLAWPASLYLEGSDQHRGWFHSSLLESCGTRGRAPYDAVLTHGFVMDEAGRKMSKSLGNVVAPQEVVEKFGADILRLWVVSSDYSEDLRIGPEIIKHQADAYRRLRNTLRFLIGNLDGFDSGGRLDHARLPELERWVRHRLFELDRLRQKCIAEFDFHRLFSAIHNFCAVELSAFYLDIRKDALYCDAGAGDRRRAALTLLDDLFSCLTAWLAPVLCFTAEEAWLHRNPGDGESVHLRVFPEIPAEWEDAALAEKWETVRDLRRVVTGAIEIERAEGRLGSSLEAAATVHLAPAQAEIVGGIDLAEIAITSAAVLAGEAAPADAYRIAEIAGIAAVIKVAEGEKCARCWKVLPEVGTVAGHEDLCGRCAEAVGDTPLAVSSES